METLILHQTVKFMQTVSLELLSYLKSVSHVINILLLLSLYRNYLEGEKDIFGGINVELTLVLDGLKMKRFSIDISYY